VDSGWELRTLYRIRNLRGLFISVSCCSSLKTSLSRCPRSPPPYSPPHWRQASKARGYSTTSTAMSGQRRLSLSYLPIDREDEEDFSNRFRSASLGIRGGRGSKTRQIPADPRPSISRWRPGRSFDHWHQITRGLESKNSLNPRRPSGSIGGRSFCSMMDQYS